MLVDLDADFVVERIYEAASNPDRWSKALEAASGLFDADAMLLIYGYHPAGGLCVIGATGFDPYALNAYARNHLEGDELIRESMGGPVGVVVSSGRSFRGRPFFTTSMYRRILLPSDLYHLAGAAALNTLEVHASLWMARSLGSPDFSIHDVYGFKGLLPHVTRAMTVHHRVHQAEYQAEMAVRAFDRMALGMVLLDAKGAPVMVNREAERIAGRKDGFVLLADRLSAGSMSDTKNLRDLVQRVGPCGPNKVPAGAVRLSRPSGLPDYHVVVLSLPKRCRQSNENCAAKALFITNPDRGKTPVDQLFGELYGLTHAEARLVSRLLEGGGLTAAAESLGLSRNTVHSQLASVFQKTGTSSQSGLLTLLLTSVAPVEPPDGTSSSDLNETGPPRHH